jgi:hypothetical protein
MANTNHLKPHQYCVEGNEPLAATPISVRLYASDDELVRVMADRAQFVRNAVRAALLRGD